MQILVTGGAGYIGCHTCVVLAERGHQIVIADNFVNSSPLVLQRLSRLTGKVIASHRLDLRDHDALAALFNTYRFDAVVHFAGLKAVGESCERPLDYYENNVCGSIGLLQAMARANVRRIVFSSSATVYGDPQKVPLDEHAALLPCNPYGRNKLMIEQLIGDVCNSDTAFNAACLRYFNPVGAHPSGLIGEDPTGVPNNLMPFICQVAVGRRPRLRIFGNDYPTADGTGVRDYLHVIDLARAHADALEYLADTGRNLTVNLGTGKGVSVLELVRAFEAASGREVPFDIVDRRPGDAATIYADPSLAAATLGWRAELGLEAMCRDAWNWQMSNPDGYRALQRVRRAPAMRRPGSIARA